MPFYPSPNRDDGYDISDYYGVDPRLGTLGDFVELVRTAGDRGHPGDRRPRRQPHVRPAPVVPGVALSTATRRGATGTSGATSRPTSPRASRSPTRRPRNWQLDRKAGQYYLHRFYRFQPDLNIANPAVRDEICKIAAFWLALGRRPASAWTRSRSCSRPTGIPEHMDGDPKRWLRSLRSFVGRRNGEAMLLGEVNTAIKDLSSYFGGATATRCTWSSRSCSTRACGCRSRAARPSRSSRSSRSLPVVPHDNAWATFLRNHDELTLDQLTVSQRDEVFAAFGPKPAMQLYGHGLRRRVATMLGGDGPRLRMAWSLMFSLPGTPVVFMGDEIGMGEQLRIPDRYAVRVPMQWSRGATAASRPPPRATSSARSPAARSVPPRSTSPTSAATRARCCGSSAA